MSIELRAIRPCAATASMVDRKWSVRLRSSGTPVCVAIRNRVAACRPPWHRRAAVWSRPGYDWQSGPVGPSHPQKACVDPVVVPAEMGTPTLGESEVVPFAGGVAQRVGCFPHRSVAEREAGRDRAAGVIRTSEAIAISHGFGNETIGVGRDFHPIFRPGIPAVWAGERSPAHSNSP